MTGDDPRRTGGPVEQLPLSDWADQDLLTKNEARERLIDEIGETRAWLSQLLRDSPDNTEIPLLTRRLNAMESIRDEYGAYLGGR